MTTNVIDNLNISEVSSEDAINDAIAKFRSGINDLKGAVEGSSTISDEKISEYETKLSELEDKVDAICDDENAKAEKQGEITEIRSDLMSLKTTVQTQSAEGENEGNAEGEDDDDEGEDEGNAEGEDDDDEGEDAGSDTGTDEPEETPSAFQQKIDAWQPKSELGKQAKLMFTKQEWKEHTGKNALRTALFVGSGVGIVYGLVSLGKALFGKKEEDDEEKETTTTTTPETETEKTGEGKGKKFFKRFGEIMGIVATAGVGYYVGHGLKTKRWNPSELLERSDKPIPMDSAIEKVTEELKKYGGDNADLHITLNGNTLSSYDEETELDIAAMRIPGLNIQFPTNYELVQTANLVNYIKSKYQPNGTYNQFVIENGNQLYYVDSDNNKELVYSGKFASRGRLQRNTCKTLAKGNNLEEFRTYLNQQYNQPSDESEQ